MITFDIFDPPYRAVHSSETAPPDSSTADYSAKWAESYMKILYFHSIGKKEEAAVIDARSRAKVSSENRYDVTNIPPAARLPVRQCEQMQRSAESTSPAPDPQASQGGRQVSQHPTKQQTEFEKKGFVYNRM